MYAPLNMKSDVWLMLNGEQTQAGYIFTDIKEGKDVPVFNYVSRHYEMKVYGGVEV
jgi:hypothetical protein